MLVILESKAYLFDLSRNDNTYKEPKLIKKFDTHENSKGIGSLHSVGEDSIVILPGLEPGQVQMFTTINSEVKSFEVQMKVTQLAVNLFGKVFAITDIGGNYINLHKIEDGSLIKSFNRGKENVEITSIAFDPLCKRMAVASKKETIHIFALPKDLAPEITESN